MDKTRHGRCLTWLVAGCAASFGVFAALSPVVAEARESVSFPANYPAGMIVIKQHERRLYLTEGNGTAIRYPIAIGMAGRAWSGETSVEGKYMAPDWKAPAVVRAVHPNLKSVIPGGSPHNPMGAAAITLRLSEVAIHGTTASMRRSVGTAASFGCIRMYNEDVLDLYQRVSVGTPVVSIP
ncbi:L,D-transpeptidase [Methyloferula stellata]|uniref:L,D-transpeptidase n=1 Tax=Methyloferula stellata TaxID=876270 RepID=UPI000376FBDF|nr:L,D-transpeptidase [Methyloferula stellata]